MATAGKSCVKFSVYHFDKWFVSPENALTRENQNLLSRTATHCRIFSFMLLYLSRRCLFIVLIAFFVSYDRSFQTLTLHVLQSETAALIIPSLDLTLTHGTLGGRFTTVEGILSQIHTELAEKGWAFFGGSGDSTTSELADDRRKYTTFLEGLKALMEIKEPFELILDDPLSNSYIQSLYAPDPDPQLEVEVYERTWDQNEELGLNDMRVEEGDIRKEEEREKEAEERDKNEGAGKDEDAKEVEIKSLQV